VARDDWRLRIELPEEERARGFLSRIGIELGSEASDLARELAEQRLAATHNGSTVFVYTPSGLQAEQARRVVEAELKEQGIEPVSIVLEHWLNNEDRWDDEPPGPDLEEETLARGYAPWEVRIEAGSLREARELAEQLEREGYSVVRAFRFVIAGAASREEAQELARRVHGEVEPGGELVYEVAAQNPFAVFGGLGGAGTPL
jgi:hypothetical protein